MLDRVSKFSDDEIVELLKTKFVPVALDQWYTRRQDDDEGRFYQSVVKQGPRNDMNHTTQGLYVCDAKGKLLGFNNNRHSGPLKKILRDTAAKFKGYDNVGALKSKDVDPEYDRAIPDGATVVRVNTKVLGGYEETDDVYLKIFQESIARDNLWILAEERNELEKGKFPEALARRIARFHLIDNTRGEPLMWANDQVKSLKIEMDADGNLTGSAKIESKRSGYEVMLRGVVKVKNDRVEQFDMVAKGLYYGDGPYTKNAPKGKFPLAVAFRLADGKDVADPVAPQGTKGWKDQYLKNQ